MPYYSVIQYLPDPVADERVNIGVLVFDSRALHVRFVDNWKRVKQFASEDILFLRDFARTLSSVAEGDLPIPNFMGGVELNEDKLREITKTWVNSIQFTPPRTSTLEGPHLVQTIADRYLKQAPVRRRARGRLTAARIAGEEITDAVTNIVGDEALELVKRNSDVLGAIEPHAFDVVVENGEILLAAQALSFEVQEDLNLGRLIDSTAWKVEDVLKRREDLLIAIAVLPPKDQTSRPYERARHVFSQLGASLVPEKELWEWTVDVLPSERLKLPLA